MEAMIAKASPEIRQVLRARMYGPGPTYTPPPPPPPPPTLQSWQLNTTAEVNPPPPSVLPAAGELLAAGIAGDAYLAKMAAVDQTMRLALLGIQPATAAAEVTAGTAIAAGGASGVEGGALFGPVGIVAGLAIGTAIAAGVYLWHSNSNSGPPAPASAGFAASQRASSTPTPAAPASDLSGTYVITYGEAVGGCGAGTPPATMTISLSGDTITVTLGSVTMRGHVSGGGSFAAVDVLNGGATYSISGTFAKEPVTVQHGSYSLTRDTSGCGYSYTAAKR
jgi:hypothetical protein